MSVFKSGDVQDFIDLIGVERALRLAKYRRNLYIPGKPTEELIALLGDELAKEVSTYFGGMCISLPLQKLRISIRNDAIVKCYRANLQVKDIAKIFKISERAVFKIIKKYGSHNPPPCDQKYA
ncbi:MAG: Mor transcription activator family protein [Pseudomonadota bacterium]